MRAALVEGLAQRGVRVAADDVNADLAAETAAQLSDRIPGSEIRSIGMDVRSQADHLTSTTGRASA